MHSTNNKSTDSNIRVNIANKNKIALGTKVVIRCFGQKLLFISLKANLYFRLKT